MSYSTYNGTNIVPMPSTPGFKEFAFHQNDSVAMTQSPFTKQQQVQYWVGADFWEADVTLPPLTDAEARPWFAWFASMRGMLNATQVSDPVHSVPGGAATGNCTLGANILPGQYYISLSGLSPVSTAGVLLPGDYLQIGYRLHQVAGVTAINSDGSGNAASVEIWPSIRDPQSAGNGVDLFETSGLFRLADNKRSWSIEADSVLWTLSFKLVELR